MITSGFENQVADAEGLAESSVPTEPSQLVLFLYDLIIAACKKRDSEDAVGTLITLIESLDFKQDEISNGLFRLYEFCMRTIKEGDFDTALRILTELRDVWAEATANLEEVVV